MNKFKVAVLMSLTIFVFSIPALAQKEEEVLTAPTSADNVLEDKSMVVVDYSSVTTPDGVPSYKINIVEMTNLGSSPSVSTTSLDSEGPINDLDVAVDKVTGNMYIVQIPPYPYTHVSGNRIFRYKRVYKCLRGYQQAQIVCTGILEFPSQNLTVSDPTSARGDIAVSENGSVYVVIHSANPTVESLDLFQISGDKISFLANLSLGPKSVSFDSNGLQSSISDIELAVAQNEQIHVFVPSDTQDNSAHKFTYDPNTSAITQEIVSDNIITAVATDSLGNAYRSMVYNHYVPRPRYLPIIEFSSTAETFSP